MKRGFTIIELLVVAAIIALLAGIVLTMLSTSRQRGEDAGVKQTLHQIRNALELYHSDNGNYPPADQIETLLVPDFISALPAVGAYFYSDECTPFGNCFLLDAEIKDESNPDYGKCWRDDTSGTGIQECY